MDVQHQHQSQHGIFFTVHDFSYADGSDERPQRPKEGALSDGLRLVTAATVVPSSGWRSAQRFVLGHNGNKEIKMGK